MWEATYIAWQPANNVKSVSAKSTAHLRWLCCPTHDLAQSAAKCSSTWLWDTPQISTLATTEARIRVWQCPQGKYKQQYTASQALMACGATPHADSALGSASQLSLLFNLTENTQPEGYTIVFNDGTDACPNPDTRNNAEKMHGVRIEAGSLSTVGTRTFVSVGSGLALLHECTSTQYGIF